MRGAPPGGDERDVEQIARLDRTEDAIRSKAQLRALLILMSVRPLLA
jgi:hypothetical protein